MALLLGLALATAGSPATTSAAAAPTEIDAAAVQSFSYPRPARTGDRTPLAVGRNAYVAVSVATLWRSPSSVRPVDKGALTNPVGIRHWLATMSDRDRLGLVGRADTQALMGERVIVTALSGSWAKVVVPEQPTPLDKRGYPGWLPAHQLTARAPAVSSLVATVTAKTTWLRTDDAAAKPAIEISFGTRLPRVGQSGDWVRVVAPNGRLMRVWHTRVAVTAPTSPAPPATGADIVRTAQMFHGLPYLWAGRSGFGFDCSGLTSLVYRARGVTIPRDADAQAVKGTAVSSSSPRAGDLMFYARNGKVHHVSIFAGSGKMVHAPRTGVPVQTVTATTPYSVRRFLG